MPPENLAMKAAYRILPPLRRFSRERDAANARAQAERARADAEKAHADAEKAHADAEKSHADAEKARADAEKGRADAEKARADAERARADSEAARVNSMATALKNLKLENSKLRMTLAAVDIDNEALAGMTADEYTALGYQLLRTGKASDAIRAYEKAVALEPGRRDTIYGLGEASYNDCRCELAVKCFQDLIASDPDTLRYRFFLGASQHLAGRLKAAVAAWADEMEAQSRLASEAGLSTTTRFLPGMFTQAIGHIAHIDIWAKRQLLGLSPAERYVIHAPSGRIANRAYLDCWSKYFDIVYGEDADLAKESYLRDDNLTVISLNSQWLWFLDAACQLEAQWEASGRGPLLQLSEEHIARGREAMAAMGLPREAWFVGLHVRDAGYDKDDQIFYSRRNARISDYLLAIKKVTDAGGWVVRMGDASAAPMPDLPQVIDYAHASRKDWLDVFLFASARFFIGTNSGPVNVACTFGVPALITNSAPMGIQSYFGNTVTLPQLLCSSHQDRYVAFAEQMAEPIAWTDSDRLSSELGFTPVKNTPEEIAGGVDEMLARANATLPVDVEDDARQARFRAALASAGISSRSRVGRQFLKDHADLLG